MGYNESDLKQAIQSLGGVEAAIREARKQIEGMDRQSFKKLASESPVFAGVEVTDEVIDNFFKLMGSFK